VPGDDVLTVWVLTGRHDKLPLSEPEIVSLLQLGISIFVCLGFNGGYVLLVPLQGVGRLKGVYRVAHFEVVLEASLEGGHVVT